MNKKLAQNPPVRSAHSIIFIFDGSFAGGGAERVATRLLGYWVNNNRRVDVITRHGPEFDFYHIPKGLNRIVINPGHPPNLWVKIIRQVPNLIQLRRAIKACPAPVVLSFLTRTNIRTIIACIGLKKRVVISERNDVSRQQHPWPLPVLRKLLYRWADVVTANSAIALDSMRGFVPASKLAYVPNPVEFPAAQATPSHSCTILNVARLVSQKAQALILDAFACITPSPPNWRIEILGEGEERDSLLDVAAAHGLSDRFTLHGVVSDPSPYYLSAGIFVLPSMYEGTPNALLEAMAHGLPCIISDSLPGALEHVEHGVTGLVFRSGDKVDLADKLSMLMTDPALRDRLGCAARTRMQAFTPERVMQEWDAVLYPK